LEGTKLIYCFEKVSIRLVGASRDVALGADNAKFLREALIALVYLTFTAYDI
jgi:hypothetical protein